MVVDEKSSKHTGDESSMFRRFLILFIVGFFIIFLGVIIFMVAAVLSDGSASFGVFVFIGPFPMVVGAGPEATWMVLFAIILAISSIIMFLMLRREKRKTNV